MLINKSKLIHSYCVCKPQFYEYYKLNFELFSGNFPYISFIIFIYNLFFQNIKKIFFYFYDSKSYLIL